MASIPTKAMVLAAGLGLRMRPLTDQMPKPMVPVAGKSLIDRSLDLLARSGVERAVVNTSYKAEMLEAALAGRDRPSLVFSREETPLETGGGILKALPLLGDGPFFVINSDVICIDGAVPALHRLAAAWNDTKMDALLLAHPVDKAVGYYGMGDFWLGEDGTIRRRSENQAAPYVFTGIQMLHPRLFKGAPGGAFSMNILYNRHVGEDGVLNRVFSLVHDGDWLHVGDPEGLKAAEAFFKK